MAVNRTLVVKSDGPDAKQAQQEQDCFVRAPGRT